jgi:hypothetical protein
MALFYFALGQDAEKMASDSLGHYYARAPIMYIMSSNTGTIPVCHDECPVLMIFLGVNA